MNMLRHTNAQLAVLLVVLFIVFSLGVDRFFSIESAWSMAIQVSGLGILSLAMMINGQTTAVMLVGRKLKQSPKNMDVMSSFQNFKKIIIHPSQQILMICCVLKVWGK